MKHRFKGSHILAEFYGISNTNNNEDSLKICLENCCKQARLTLMKFDHVVFPMEDIQLLLCWLSRIYPFIHTPNTSLYFLMYLPVETRIR